VAEFLTYLHPALMLVAGLTSALALARRPRKPA
jgi:hypothetical protein